MDRHTHTPMLKLLRVFPTYFISPSVHPQVVDQDTLILQRRRRRLWEVPCSGEKDAITAVDAHCAIESPLQICGESFSLPGLTQPCHTALEKEQTGTNSSMGIILLRHIFITEPWFFFFQKDEASS